MPYVRIVFLGLFGGVLIAAMFGCTDSAGGRVGVSGNVKLEGQPLNEGSILFVPLDEQGSQSGAGIANGAYDMPRQSGLKPGRYLVRITSGDGKTPAGDDEAAGPGGSTNIVSVDRIPAEWNVNTKQQVEVKSKGPNKFDFDIPKAVTPKRP